jgi:tryptophan 2,3-dioxygenase
LPSDDQQLYYADYLQLERLLNAQSLESSRDGPPAHDEMLFIIVHQAYELWFKQILWELDAILRIFSDTKVDERDIGRVVSKLNRIIAIEHLMLDQINVLETMTPLDFLEFRDYLIPASGFQSAQFRLIENKLGLRRQDRPADAGELYTSRLRGDDRERVEGIEEQPSLFDLVEDWLQRTPFLDFGDFDFWSEYRIAVQNMLGRDAEHIRQNSSLTKKQIARQLKGLESTRQHFEALFDASKHDELVRAGKRRLSHRSLKAALLINLYRDEPILHLPFRLLTGLMDVDEVLTTWRQRHALMAMRMIGTRIGTGGSSGHEYLRRSAEGSRVYSDLFDLATYLIPRSSLPRLPESVVDRLGFTYQNKLD